MKKLTLAAALWAAFLLPAGASTPPAWNPPARFDHAFDGKIYARYVNGWQMFALCHMAWACTPVGGDQGTRRGTCTMILPKEGARILGRKVDRAGLLGLVRHERGHCNGWPANHPR